MELLLNNMEQTSTAASPRVLMPPPSNANVPTNYVSMFRIDGKPILPPLMTNEKRKLMRKLKEKAVELEKKLAAKRCHKDTRVLAGENDDAPYAASFCELCPSARSNFSNVSQSSSEVATSVADKDSSYILLSNLMKNTQEHRREFKDSSTCTKDETITLESPAAVVAVDMEAEKARQLKTRLQKLKKSETLIYDNCSNSIIMPMVDIEQHGSDYDLQQVLQNPNLGYRTIKSNIPVICINPPTPMIAKRDICEPLDASMDSLSGDVLSPDSPQSERSSSESNNTSALSLNSHRKVTNITAKIIKFETISDGGGCGTGVLERLSPPNVKQVPPSRGTVGALERLEPPNVNPPLRSATSPSLKPCSQSSHKIARKYEHKTSVENSSEVDTHLVRSNSFTLDGPSKVLLDHIRQQKFTKKYNRIYPSASATRDTVESKAKRVQKVDVLAKQRLQQQQSNRSPIRNANMSPYASNNASSTPLSAKKQRSPYEFTAGHKTGRTGARPDNKVASNSSSTVALHAARHARPKTSLTTIKPPQHSHNNRSSSVAPPKGKIEPEFLSEIEAEHRQKFAQLLAKQNEEKKRLQQAFETQQKLLLEQICEDMDKLPTVVNKRPNSNATPRSSQDNSPTSVANDHMHPPPLSLNSSCNSFSLASPSTICAESMTIDEPSSMSSNKTATTTTPTATNQRQCTPRRRLFSCDDSPPSSAKNLMSSSATATTATTATNKRPLTFTYQ